ncbi:MAG: hypothetical protein H5T45_05565 [Thermoplasmatales archaeon]|nr:hypothetical protein [Thermoplasmatales archaeon]
MDKIERLKKEIRELEEDLEKVKTTAVKNVIKNMIIRKKEALKRAIALKKLEEETE